MGSIPDLLGCPDFLLRKVYHRGAAFVCSFAGAKDAFCILSFAWRYVKIFKWRSTMAARRPFLE
jgi:hypothetical protein